MSYTELCKSGAPAAEMREFLVSGDTVAVTVRIPQNLRDSAKEEATLRGTTFSALLRECLIEELAGRV